MQLDKTLIAVRERNAFETMDLALHVLRHYWRPLLIAQIWGVLPLALINWILIGWMANFDAESYNWRNSNLWYQLNMAWLVFLEAPLASVFATTYLGHAVFMERPSLRQVWRDVWKMSHRIIWCQLLVRGVAAAWCLLWLLDTESNEPDLEILVWLIGGVMWFIRALRPFVNEIVLLERNPLRASKADTMTVHRRSSVLHNVNGGDLFLRHMLGSIVAVLLSLAIANTFTFFSGVFLNDWSQGPLLIHVTTPLAMWLTALYFCVVRFLNYLDARIRQEGWEVELRLRAEAARLSSKLS